MAKKLFLNVSFTLLALMLCMGVLCNFCKASGLPDNIQDIVSSDFQSHGYNYSDYASYFTDIYNRDDFNVVRIRRSENNILYYFYMNSGFQVRTNYAAGFFPYWGFDSYLINIAPSGITWNTSNYCYYALTITNTIVKLDGFKPLRSNYYDSNTVSLYSFPTSSPNNSNGAYGISLERSVNFRNMHCTNASVIFNSGDSTYNTLNGIYDSDSIICSSDFYYQNSSTSGFYKEANWETYYPAAVEDDRLSIYTLETNNGKQLNIDISAFRSYTPAAFYNFSDIDLTLNCDGSDVSYSLDSNNSNIIDIWSSSNNVYTVQTLYSYFDLDSYEDVYISEVDFTLTVTSPGGSGDTDFHIACQYYLKKTHESMEPIIVPDPEYNNTEIYNTTQINNIKQDLHEYSSRFSFLQGSWNFVLEQDLPEFPGWATVYQNYVWFADGNSDTTYRGHWFQMANNIPSIADLTRPFDPSVFLEQNKTFAFYDVILLKVFTVEVLSGSSVIENYDLAGYLVFISDRYYDHYNARLNLDILTQLQLSAENSVLFFDAAKARLDGIAADLDTGFNGFLDVGTGTQFKIISWLQTINDNMSGSFISLENILSDGFSSVVSAIGNITPGGSSYSLPALSDALSFLFTPTLEWSAINYDDYQESLGVLALPFEFTFDVLDICESQYDPKFKIHLNDLSLNVPLEAGSDPEMTSFTVFEDQDIVQDPLDVFPSGLWSTLQYLNAFGLVMVQALSTYLHIFRKG